MTVATTYSSSATSGGILSVNSGMSSLAGVFSYVYLYCRYSQSFSTTIPLRTAAFGTIDDTIIIRTDIPLVYGACIRCCLGKIIVQHVSERATHHRDLASHKVAVAIRADQTDPIFRVVRRSLQKRRLKIRQNSNPRFKYLLVLRHDEGLSSSAVGTNLPKAAAVLGSASYALCTLTTPIRSFPTYSFLFPSTHLVHIRNGFAEGMHACCSDKNGSDSLVASQRIIKVRLSTCSHGEGPVND